MIFEIALARLKGIVAYTKQYIFYQEKNDRIDIYATAENGLLLKAVYYRQTPEADLIFADEWFKDTSIRILDIPKEKTNITISTE